MGSQEVPGVIGKFDLEIQNEAGQRLTEFCQENTLVIITKTIFQQCKRWLYTWTSPSVQCWNQSDPLQPKMEKVYQSEKTRPGVDCGSDHECLIAEFRLNLKAVGKTTRWFRYDLNYTVKVTNRFKGLDLIDKCLKNYGQRFVTLYRRQWSRTSPRKRNGKRQNGCLRRPYK